MCAGFESNLEMSYLVDGNNVMAQRVGWHRDKAGARRGLMGELSRYARAAKVTLAVVFDGAPDEHFPDGSSYMGVQVFYAERGSNADERIKAMVDASRERRTLIVVTSDRALADYVRRSGAQVVRAGDFRRRLADEAREEESARATPQQREPPVKSADLKDWLRYFGEEEE